MASAPKSARQPSAGRLDGSLRELHIKETIAKDGGQAFAGVNLGTINYAAAKTPRVSSTDKIKECQDALFLTNPKDDRAGLMSAKGRRVEHTCEWIKSNDTFRSWLQGDPPLLWISGGPGKGKTMLSIYLTEDLEREEARDVHILYYFCSHQDEKRNNTVYVLRGLLWQLIQKPGVEDLVLQHFAAEEKNNDQLLLSSRESLWRLFAAIARDPALGRVCCVLDGLDECDDESTRWLVKKLNALATTVAEISSNEHPRLIIISRDMPSMRALVASTRCARIRLDPDHNEQVNDDIIKVVSANVHKFSWMDGFSPEFETEAQNILLERSEGTFLWVGCVMNELEREATATGLLQKLRSFPKGLDAIYKRMLLQIDDEDRRHQASLILRWVTLATSPLSLSELAAAIQTQQLVSTVEQGSGDQHVVVGPSQVIRDQVKMCGSMLQVHGETVVLVHNSAREFLLRIEADDNTILKELRIRPAEAHMLLALTCLECIKRSPLISRALDPDDEFPWKEFPLLRYAVVNWLEHARLSTDQGKGLFSSAKFLIGTDDRLRENWWQTYAACVRGKGQEWGRPITLALSYTDGKLSDIIRGIELKIQRELNEEVLPPLHMACRFGLLEWVRALLEARQKDRTLQKAIGALDKNGLDALTWAAIEGHVKVVELLLDYHANINATTALLRKTALSALPSRWLLSYLRECTDGDAIWTGKHTVLYRTVFRGHNNVLKLLLERGASPNLKGWADLSPLHAAAMTGREEALRLLLEYGGHKTVNAMLSVTHITPLQYSVEADHYNIAKMLLDNGADVHIKQVHSRYTALHCAIAEDASTRIVELLLDKGVSIGARTSWMDTPLHLAAILSRTETIELLIARKADVHSQNSWNGNTPLHMAAKMASRSEALKCLLSHSANTDAKNSKGKTALHLAAQGTDAASVEVLLDHGASVNVKSNRGGYPLHSAAKRANSTMIQLLLARGADTNAVNKKGQTALDKLLASKIESSEAAQLLQSAGALRNPSSKPRFTWRSNFSKQGSLDTESKRLSGSFSNSSLSIADEKATQPAEGPI